MYTLFDSFEWIHGYSVKYGLFATNFSNPNLPSRPKTSSILYAQVRSTCGLIKLWHTNFIQPFLPNVYIHVLCKRHFYERYYEIAFSLYGLKWMKVSQGAKIRYRYNQVPHLTQDTNGKVTNSQ